MLIVYRHERHPITDINGLWMAGSEAVFDLVTAAETNGRWASE